MTDCELRYVATVDDGAWSESERDAGRRVEAWLDRCAGFIRETFSAVPAPRADTPGVEAILRVLLRREFNYQATGRVAHLFPALGERIARVVAEGRPLPLYFLHHGGYRASSGPVLADLVFAPDATDLLLLYQVARLQRAMTAVYPPGIAFVIVVNNGVAMETNDIPLTATEGYAAGLRGMIAALGATAAVTVLVQSELAPAAPVPPVPPVEVDETAHRTIERFLGRSCSVEEAGHRAAVYVASEARWWDRIEAIVIAAAGLILRQVAHQRCLSFRPFPGGAIRAQNGAIGVTLRDGGRDPLPFLVTSITARQRELHTIPVRHEVLPGGPMA
ncbi:hypothetical protein [Sphingomonas solaris]|uniref:Uncharacterized protein n=1 Tax=Alterirhizorhabdus solaris TaxID=2529389 RepID=A0A558R8U9_9SPHN|nr:hypothetical protein [Sphingomonas solaris]TVV75821.1 hypothetical protein FOY91_05945 [Sphingomonas solaris]